MVAPIQPPQSIDTERQILGAIMKDAEAINRVIEKIDSEGYFYEPKHRSIFRAILDQYKVSEPCDITNVANRLEGMGRLDGIGGRLYLVDLVEGVMTASQVVSHCKIITEKWILRELIDATNDISGACYAAKSPADQILDRAESEIFQISESRMRKGFSHIAATASLVSDQVDNPELNRDSVKTGFTEIDQLTDGLRNSDLIVVAGRPSMGKTAIAMNIAENVAMKSHVGVGIFSLEMSREQLVSRMMCGQADVNQQKMRARTLSEEEKKRLVLKAHQISQAPIYIDDSPYLSSLEMRAKARRLKASNPEVGLIIVDYVQLMTGSGNPESRQVEVSQISRGMKALAKELNVPIVMVAQLNRMAEGRSGNRPMLSDLRESGAIEQDADVVMLVFRKEYYLFGKDSDDPEYEDARGKGEIIIAKQRNGPTGVVKLAFRKELAKFENLYERGPML